MSVYIRNMTLEQQNRTINHSASAALRPRRESRCRSDPLGGHENSARIRTHMRCGAGMIFAAVRFDGMRALIFVIDHAPSADPINFAEVRIAAVNAKKGPKSWVAHMLVKNKPGMLLWK